ncbi:MAG: phosphatidylglycerophosphatase A [Elusimicrobia bacterium]|nr:phosphatidylglycerophosphatase A [Elusimicrobiota bacterium]
MGLRPFREGGPERVILLLATGCYISYIPVWILGSRKWSGAGLFGTIAAAPFWLLLPSQPFAYAAFLTAAVAAAVWVCGRAEKSFGRHDDPRIVLDEVVGLWTALAFLPKTLPVLGLGFLFFRLLDSVKLPPYSWFDRVPGGIGIVGDDIGAAVCANLLVRACLAHWPGLA